MRDFLPITFGLAHHFHQSFVLVLCDVHILNPDWRRDSGFSGNSSWTRPLWNACQSSQHCKYFATSFVNWLMLLVFSHQVLYHWTTIVLSSWIFYIMCSGCGSHWLWFYETIAFFFSILCLFLWCRIRSVQESPWWSWYLTWSSS